VLSGPGVPSTIPAAVPGIPTSVYVAGVGARIVWQTGNIRRRRKVQGSTFLVPLESTTFDTNGLVASSVVNVRAAGNGPGS
jgi:hypothetical protein